MTASGDEDVRRLDIAMDDSRGIRGIQSVGDFDGQWERRFDGEWTLDAMLQGRSSRYSITMNAVFLCATLGVVQVALAKIVPGGDCVSQPYGGRSGHSRSLDQLNVGGEPHTRFAPFITRP